MFENKNGILRYLTGGALLLFMVLLLAGCTQSSQSSQSGTTNATMSGTSGSQVGTQVMPENRTGVQQTQAAIAAVIPDGTYSINTTYAYHSGVNSVEISITLQNDTITNASVTPLTPPDAMSAMHISNFNNAIPTSVIGQNINSLNLPHNVAGSSLTTAAFVQYADNLVQNYSTSQ